MTKENLLKDIIKSTSKEDLLNAYSLAIEENKRLEQMNIKLENQNNDMLKIIIQLSKDDNSDKVLMNLLKELHMHEEAWDKVCKKLDEWMLNDKTENDAFDAYERTLDMIKESMPKECDDSEDTD